VIVLAVTPGPLIVPVTLGGAGSLAVLAGVAPPLEPAVPDEPDPAVPVEPDPVAAVELPELLQAARASPAAPASTAHRSARWRLVLTFIFMV
jgi:hypothetical protein